MELAAADYDPNTANHQPSNKVCFICNWHVYIFDLNLESKIMSEVDDDEFITRAPTIIIDPGHNDIDACCVVNSTLYIFEGVYIRRRSCFNDDDLIETTYRKSVFTLDLSSDISSGFNLQLDKSMLGKAPEMLAAKEYPTAVPSPDCQKILVFSRDLEFEVYDVAAQTWRKLPGIFEDRDVKGLFFFGYVKAYGFITNHVFFVKTEKKGMFSLDIESNKDNWENLDRFGREIPFWDDFSVVDNHLCVANFGVYDISGENGLFENRRFYIAGTNYFRCLIQNSRCFTIVDDDDDNDVSNGGLKVCYARTATRDPDDDVNYLIMDLCSCDVGKYIEDKGKMGDSTELSTNIVNTFRFVISGHRVYGDSKLYTIRV